MTDVLGSPVSTTLEIRGSDEKIVLLEYEDARSSDFKNLLRVGSDWTIRWYAEYPESNKPADAYVSVSWEAEHLIAKSWSGFVAELDPETGRVRSQS